MQSILSNLKSIFASLADKSVAFASTLKPQTLAWGGIALALVILLSVNLVSTIGLKTWKADLTEDKLFTISPGTRTVLTTIDEPIRARVYFSKRLGEELPSYGRYFDRVRSLLEQFRDMSGGKLQLEFLEPEPYSDAEDRAVAAGLRGMRYTAEGDVGYFGLTATNSTDNQETVAFFEPSRESFVEYDLTKLIHTLANPKKRTVGLITSLPLDGGKMPTGNPNAPEQTTPPWLVMDQIREFFNIETIDQTATSIPTNIDVLMIAQPVEMKAATAYAIDQYALKGGKILVFIDPASEMAQFQLMQKQGEGRTELVKLLKTWGAGFDLTKVAADVSHARRVQFRGRPGEQPMVTEFVAWLNLDRSNLDEQDVLAAGISNLNVGSAGILTPIEGASTKFTPLLRTSGNAMQIEATKVGMGADPVGLLRAYQAGGKPLTLAARLSGPATTAFPNGKPSGDATADSKASTPDKDHAANGTLNVVVVADTDILADQFWVDRREMMGQEMMVPAANNAAFVVGALENLTGSDALIALRGRGIKDRPFTLVEDIRRDAERAYREKEQALTDKLKKIEEELRTLEASGGNGSVMLSDAERKAVDKAKAEMLETRRELRNVKLALRQSIDRLSNWLQFANIAFVPLLMGLGGIGYAAWRSRTRSA